MNNEVQTLPEKCCANCGFLFSVSNKPSDPDNIIVDPDRIRDIDYPPDYNPNNIPGNVLTTKPYGVRIYYRTNTPTGDPVKWEQEDHEEIYYRYLGWSDIQYIGCYWHEFNPLKIHQDMSMKQLDDSRYGDDYIPMARDGILSKIRKDQTDCKHHFNYLPGLKPNQHIEVMDQYERDKILREFQSRQNELFLQLEETAAKRDVYWKNKEAEDRKLIYWVTFLALIISTISLLKDIIYFVFK